jgi:hypothetical protein
MQDREDAARHQDATEAMIRMREPRRVAVPHPDPDPRGEIAVAAARAATLVMATLSAHAPTLPEHVIKAAAIAAGNATAQRNTK